MFRITTVQSENIQTFELSNYLDSYCAAYNAALAGADVTIRTPEGNSSEGFCWIAGTLYHTNGCSVERC